MKTLARTLVLLGIASMPAVAGAADAVPTTLTLPEPITAQHATAPILDVSLLAGETGVEGREITFELRSADPDVTLDSEPVVAVTDIDGLASAAVGLGAAPGEYEILVAFAGDEEYLGADGVVPVTVIQAASKMTYTGISSGVRGSTISLRVRLQHAQTNANLRDRTIAFSIPGLLDATAVTNASGEAAVSFKLSALYGSYPLTVTYDGEEGYAGSSMPRTIAITWSWTFSSEGGLGTIRLNDVLNEYNVIVPGADSGIVTGADISIPVPNLAAAQIVVGTRAGQDASLEFVGEVRFGFFQAAGHFGTTPFALGGSGIV